MPRSIYQYSNMAPRLSGQTSIFGVQVFSLYPSLFWELRDKRNMKNLPFRSESLGVMLEY